MDATRARPIAEEAHEENEGFDLANIPPRVSGLPMVVWLSDGTGVRHDLRVKVSQEHGPRIRTRDWAVVSVNPEPHLLHGDLSSRDFDSVVRWIRLNEAVIVDFREGRLFTDELLARLQPL